MYVVVMAGGSGTRFWPVSRKTRPKQFLDITGKGPMVIETCDRMASVVSDEQIILVLGQEHLQEARALFKERRVRLLAEPVGRNTAACIGLGAVCAAHLESKEPVAFLPADHYVANPGALLESIRHAAEIAATGPIVTLGIVPTRPETGYGYIQWSEERPDFWKQKAYRVRAFVEKPSLDKARQYLVRGDYLWNAGIFVATPQAILKEIEFHLPLLHDGLLRLKPAMGTDSFDNVLEEVYERLDSISFDYGIMERTSSPVFVVPCDCGWSDVGSWESLYELREKEHDDKQNLREGECLLVDCRGSFISSRGGRLISCLGLQNCLVVDTQDTLLVADLKKAQDVRKIIDLLKRNRRDDLL
ncbi:MAG: mannose-1-phosphate guanylyltransferase [Deltaproteobacteria bacterium]